MELEELKKIGNSIGFFKVEELNIDKIKLLPEVRQMCSTDKCHMYGRNWSCPPACGTLEECAADISGYKKGIIVQTKGELEDEFDGEGMMETEALHKEHFVEMHDRLKKEFPNLKIIGMSTFNERSYIAQMIQNGADGFLVKSASKEEIETAISSVLDGKMHLSSDAGISTSEQKELKNQPTLTSREKEILTLISEGFTNPQIAEKLFISLYTVETHRKNLLSKFNTNNTASLIKIAATNGLL